MYVYPVPCVPYITRGADGAEEVSHVVYRRVPDIRSVIVNLDRYHTTNRPAARANEKGPLTDGCLIILVVW